MTGAARWPLHPQPEAGEALSSWLIRVADAYGMTPGQLVRHNLGPASFELREQNLSDLDMEPPPGMLEALHERTGVPRDQLASMTIAGWVPWLLDTLDPTQGTAAFETNVQQDSVILPPGRAIKRDLPIWRAWLPDRPMMRRACPRCIEDANGETAVFALASRIPLTIGCPKHGYRLEAMFGSLGTFIAWEDEDMVPTPTDLRVTAMDRRTHEGLAIGTVSLPGRAVHVGAWLRLLRHPARRGKHPYIHGPTVLPQQLATGLAGDRTSAPRRPDPVAALRVPRLAGPAGDAACRRGGGRRHRDRPDPRGRNPGPAAPRSTASRRL